VQNQTTLPIGSIVRDQDENRYMVEALLGKGGFGAVYLVREQSARRTLFALKEVVNSDKRERDRIIFEGEVLKRLEHRALPRVYRVFDNEYDRAYLLMDYIRGANLEQLRLEQPGERVPLPQVLMIMTPVVDAVSYLHNQHPPIIHRDIKPENIIVPAASDEAVLVDFGLAKEYIPEGTTSIIRHGTPGYAAPEQYGGGSNPRTDVYGLGATLYTLLTGLIPEEAVRRWTAENDIDPLVPANQVAPAIPIPVAKDISRAMSLSSKDRFSTVEEFWQTLQVHATQYDASTPQVVVDELVVQTPVEAPLPVSRIRSKPALLFAMLFALLVIVGGGVAFELYSGRLNHATSARNVTSATVTGSTTTQTPTVQTIPYPLLARQYTGTIGDIVAQAQTNMSLSNIRQSGKNISGYFIGIGLSGIFNGTIDAFGDIQFQVAIYSGNSTLSFEGAIQIGGNIAGSYRVLNQNNQFTGEMGLWSVVPEAARQSS
jgi:eukaryotic-like serine/threonine-protein kinase